MKRYERYKPSGAEWIGEIPEHWEEKRLKYSDYVIMGQSPSSADYNTNKNGLPFLQGNAEFGTISPAPKIWCETSSKIAQKNDILLSVRAPIGAVNISDQQYGIGRGLCAVRGVRACHKFLYYHLKARKDELNSVGTGSTYTAITVDEVNNLLIPYPSSDEQRAIADHLDHKTAQIDDLIAKKQELINLLNEEKTAIINQAVTKGLNPDTPLKDSGIPWLGEIPAHWHIKKLKHILLRNKNALKTGPFGSQLKTTDFVLNGRYKVYNQRSVLEDDFDLGDDFINDQKFTELKEFEIFPGDILITTRGTIGKCAIFSTRKHKGVLHPCLIRIQVDEGVVLKDWITNYINNSSLFLSAVLLESNATTIDVIYGTDLKEIVIPVPNDLREQRDILEYINNQLLRIREADLKINKEIELLQEYRTALISESVTGKIDVRI